MVQIVDQHGRPLNKEVLKAPQTSQVAQLNRQWPEHPSKGMTIRKLPRILEAAERGDLSAQADLFEDMVERDGHVFSEMAKRKNALLTLDWSIEAPENATAEEKALAATVSSWIRDIPEFEDIILNAAEAIGHGFAAQEIEKWELDGNLWLPTKIKLRPHRWFCTTPENGDEIRLNDGTMQGSELWPFGWLMHTHNAKSGYIAQSGLYRVLVWPYLFKNYSIRDLAEFLEIYGLPARIGIAHSEITQTYADDHFSASDLKILESEPQLIVVKVSEATGTGETEGTELALAKARIAELEAGITQLSTDAATLKASNDKAQSKTNDELTALQSALDAANTTVADQVKEIDALKAQVVSLTPAKK